MRHKLHVANYMFGPQEHGVIRQPPRGGLGSVTATDAYLLGEKKVSRQPALLLQPKRGGRTQPTI